MSFKDDVFWGLAPTDNSEFLWVSHQSSSRVFRIRQPLSSTPVVDIVLGQVNGTDTDCNRGAPQISGATPNTLCLPTALSLDNSGNLWVADHLAEAGGNRRELVFNKSLFPTTNTTTIFAPNASRIFSNVGIWGPIFTPDGKMIVGFDPWDGFNPRNGRFVAVYNNPDTMTSFSTPDMYFNDYYSTPYALAMDSEHNVYISDLNRGRLLIYKDPLNYLKVTPTGGISPTPTPIIQSITPTSAPTLSPSLTKTPTPLPTNTPFPPTPTPTSTPINYVRIPYSLDELTGGSTINQWKNTLIYIKQNMNLNQLGFYNTGPSAKYEVRNSDRTGTIGTLVSSGNFRSTPNSANYYYQETNINFSNKKYYLIRVYPTTGTYYLGSTSKSYAALSFLKRSNGASKAQTTGSFQWRLRFTLK